MKYVYILLICLILYYIITRYFEKYYSQENFDPSLVPVSSIITLAKVAQKIVDGNGTLTNPANLNIGTTNAKGNLLVTGNTRTNGNEIVDGTLGVTGATTIGSTLGVTGATTVGGTLGVTGATTVGGTLGVTGATTITGVTTIGASGATAATNNLTVNGAENIKGNSKIEGTLNVTGATTSGNLTAPIVAASTQFDIKARLLPTPTNTYQIYNYDGGSLRIYSNATAKDVLTIDKDGNLNIVGNLTINGTTLTTNTANQLTVSKPIVNASPIFSNPIISGYPRINGNSIGDAYLSFYKENSTARTGWIGFTGNGGMNMSNG